MQGWKHGRHFNKTWLKLTVNIFQLDLEEIHQNNYRVVPAGRHCFAIGCLLLAGKTSAFPVPFECFVNRLIPCLMWYLPHERLILAERRDMTFYFEMMDDHAMLMSSLNIGSSRTALWAYGNGASFIPWKEKGPPYRQRNPMMIDDRRWWWWWW